MPDKQIFFDPQRKRWKRLRRILDITAVVSTLVLAGFIFNVLIEDIFTAHYLGAQRVQFFIISMFEEHKNWDK